MLHKINVGVIFHTIILFHLKLIYVDYHKNLANLQIKLGLLRNTNYVGRKIVILRKLFKNG